ncbi:Protein of unknown function [Cotesia congregata]|uniref:Uncharacterized protein n=1 Tax=Cotesia congregata TaxID=51543 RepID=A0A8J2MH31_COTCN|nr:Protein of unknown function [Cotesia congregata]
MNDTHAPYDKRIIGAAMNSPDFSRDFNCSLGSNMNPCIEVVSKFIKCYIIVKMINNYFKEIFRSIWFVVFFFIFAAAKNVSNQTDCSETYCCKTRDCFINNIKYSRCEFVEKYEHQSQTM